MRPDSALRLVPVTVASLIMPLGSTVKLVMQLVARKMTCDFGPVTGRRYTYDLGPDLYSPSPSRELPNFNQNQRPIAKAEAWWKESAARFVARHANVIGRQGAGRRILSRFVRLRPLTSSDQERQRQQVERSYRLGETGPAGALTANVERAILELAPFEALARAAMLSARIAGGCAAVFDVRRQQPSPSPARADVG